jgi:hypothetical protein
MILPETGPNFPDRAPKTKCAALRGGTFGILGRGLALSTTGLTALFVIFATAELKLFTRHPVSLSGSSDSRLNIAASADSIGESCW